MSHAKESPSSNVDGPSACDSCWGCLFVGVTGRCSTSLLGLLPVLPDSGRDVECGAACRTLFAPFLFVFGELWLTSLMWATRCLRQGVGASATDPADPLAFFETRSVPYCVENLHTHTHKNRYRPVKWWMQTQPPQCLPGFTNHTQKLEVCSLS